MEFTVAESAEEEDHYTVILSFRPEVGFTGRQGQEQFFISKEGEVAHRQVLNLPGTKGRRSRLIIIAGVAVAVGVVAIGASSLFCGGPFGAPPPPTPTTLPAFTAVPNTVSVPNPTPVPTPTPLATPAPIATAPAVPTPATVSTSFLGTYEYLVDGQGMTLYAFTLDTQGTDSTATLSFCTSEICIKAWPPLWTGGFPVARDGAMHSLLGTFARDGNVQVTYNGWPLYRHIEDSVPGETLGHGVNRDFSILKPNGATSFPFFPPVRNTKSTCTNGSIPYPLMPSPNLTRHCQSFFDPVCLVS